MSVSMHILTMNFAERVVIRMVITTMVMTMTDHRPTCRRLCTRTLYHSVAERHVLSQPKVICQLTRMILNSLILRQQVISNLRERNELDLKVLLPLRGLKC